MLAPPGFCQPAWALGSSTVRVYAPFRPLPYPAVAAGLDLLQLGSADWFVDFGCGDGRVLEAALARARRVTGVELDAELAAAAKARCPRAEVLHEPIGWTPPVGPDCGVCYLLPWALPDFLARCAAYFAPGFRLLVPLPAGTALPAAAAETLQLVASMDAETVVLSDDGLLRLLVHTFSLGGKAHGRQDL